MIVKDCMYIAHHSPAASYQEALMMSPYERQIVFDLIKDDVKKDIMEKTGKEVVF